MTAVAWSAIGLLALTLFSSLHYLGGRIDALGLRMDAQGAALANGIATQGGEPYRRIQALGAG